MTARTLLAGVAVLLAAPLLTGCDITGVVDLTAVSTVSVDLNLSGGDTSGCGDYAGLLSGLTLDETTGVDGCRVHGTADTQDLFNRIGVFGFSTTGDQHLLLANLNGFGYTTDLNLAVDVVMPGSVVHASSGQVSGNRVHVTDASAGILVIESSTAPNPVPWQVLGGAAALALAFVLGWWLRGRRAARTRADPALEPAPSDGLVPPTSAVLAAEAVTWPAVDPTGPTPASSPLPDFTAPDAPGIPFHWGPPSGDPVPDVPPPPEPEPAPDRSMWAPPSEWRP